MVTPSAILRLLPALARPFLRRNALLPIGPLAGVVFLLSAAAAVAQTAVGLADYRVGPKDLLQFKVAEVADLNTEARVDDDGAVLLPIVGKVAVGGQTVQGVADQLKVLLETRYVQRATVFVQVQEYRSKPITVFGAVKSPGYISFTGRVTLIEALLAAGGMTDQVGVTIYVLRHADNGLADRITIDADDLLLHADPAANIPILPGDIINVSAPKQIIIYCLGELKTSGAISFSASERTTVLTAVARAGGLSERASSKLRVKRTDASGKSTEFVVDFKAILAGRAQDVELKHGDILIAKGTFF